MEALIARKNMPYHPIDVAKLHSINISESRGWLEKIDLQGEVLHTNGHGEQSLSLLLDSGDAFIGDLAPENMIAEDDWKSKDSWALLRRKGARFIWPAHAEAYFLSNFG